MTTGSGRRRRSCFAHLLGGITIIALLILSTGNAFSADGDLIWATRAGGTYDDANDVGRGISTFSDGTSVVTGYFIDTAVFGPGEANETTLVSAGSDDIFVAKYNSDGTLAWATRAGGTDSEYGRGISTFSDGSSVVTGWFSGTAVFGAGEPNETTLVSDSYSIFCGDIFIAKYNADGTLDWVTRAGGGFDSAGRGISTFFDGTSVVTGYFRDAAVFGAGESNETKLLSTCDPGNSDIFVARYNADGTLVWAKNAGGAGWDNGFGISSFADGTSVVTGSIEGTAVFGAGEPNETTLVSAGGDDIVIARYNSDGTLAWATRAGGTSWEEGYGISCFADGTSVVTGSFKYAAVFGASEPNETTLVSAGYENIFVAKYNANGTLAWATRAGGTNWDRGQGISSFPDGTSVVTGFFYKTAVFGPGEPNETTLISDGNCDICVAKYEGSLHPPTPTPWPTVAVGTVASKRTPTPKPTRTPWPTVAVGTVASKRTPSPTSTQTRTPTPRPTSPPYETPTPTPAKGKVGLR